MSEKLARLQKEAESPRQNSRRTFYKEMREHSSYSGIMSSQYWYYLLDRIIGLEKHERITEDAQARMLKEAVQISYRRGGEETIQTQPKSRRKTGKK